EPRGRLLHRRAALLGRVQRDLALEDRPGGEVALVLDGVVLLLAKRGGELEQLVLAVAVGGDLAPGLLEGLLVARRGGAGGSAPSGGSAPPPFPAAGRATSGVSFSGPWVGPRPLFRPRPGVRSSKQSFSRVDRPVLLDPGQRGERSADPPPRLGARSGI